MSFAPDPDAADDAEVVDAEPVADHGASTPAGPGRRDGWAASPTAEGAGVVATAASRLPARASVPVAAQAAAVAVTGFAAGAVTAAVVRSATRRRAVKASRRTPMAGLPILGTRSFLVDVHLLDPRD